LCSCQAADFADRVASGVLTADVAAEVENLRAQHADAVAEAQVAQAEAKVALAKGSLASQRAEEWEARFNALRSRVDKAETSVRSEVVQTHA
jgi:hypothetical protein